MNTFESTLSLCMRARKLTYGFETVKTAVESGKAVLLITAADLSPKTRKEVVFLSEKYRIPHRDLPYTIDGIAQIIGRKTGVIGITDQGFCTRLMQIQNETEDNLCR